jgi:Do/DeqQ family serine protease
MKLRLELAAAMLAAALTAAPAVFIAAPAYAAVPAPADAAPMPSLAPMVKRVSPAVVNIATRGTIKEEPGQRNPLLDDPFFRRFFDAPPDSKPRERQFQSAGSGVIVDAKNGYIITNHHVVENASEITITLLDNRTFSAKVVGTDEGADIAVLQAKQPNLIAMSLGDSTKLEVGDYVVAIGNPFGLQHTVTAGIVSALGRTGINPDGYEDFIQTDASINPGNSGGPLINLQGAVVGVNSAIYTRTGLNMGISFAIPVNLVKGELPQLRDTGGVSRGWIGIETGEITAETAFKDGLEESQGAVVIGVVENGPAAAAGVMKDDVVVEFDHRRIATPRQLQGLQDSAPAGRTVMLRIIRGKQAREIPVMVLAAREEQSGAGPIGALVSEVSPALVGTQKSNEAGGVVVSSVESGSLAESAGLRPGDIILEVNRHRIGNVDTYERELKTVGAGRIILLLVRRDEGMVFIPLRIEG